MAKNLFKTITMASTALALGATISIGACTSFTEQSKYQTANRIAMPAFMIQRQIDAADFTLVAWERMHKRDAPANIYIEGDGVAWLSKKQVSLDPTPNNPVALHLASRDTAHNVGYLARPCQYVDRKTSPRCGIPYWTGKRYAPEVIAAFQAALNDMKAQYDITEFNLIGFSGGGNIAAILAAQRDDVASLRTVAGNLDHETVNRIHNVSFMPESLNARDFGFELADVPQHHFVGGADRIVPPAVYHSYRQAVGLSDCVHYTLVQDASHEDGWVEKWPDLLMRPLSCATPPIRVEDAQFARPVNPRDVPLDPPDFGPMVRSLPRK